MRCLGTVASPSSSSLNKQNDSRPLCPRRPPERLPRGATVRDGLPFSRAASHPPLPEPSQIKRGLAWELTEEKP